MNTIKFFDRWEKASPSDLLKVAVRSLCMIVAAILAIIALVIFWTLYIPYAMMSGIVKGNHMEDWRDVVFGIYNAMTNKLKSKKQ